MKPASSRTPPAAVLRDSLSLTGRGVTVGVLDSGWDRTRFDPRVPVGISIFGVQADPVVFGDDHDLHGHGTYVALRLLRVAPRVRIVPIRVFERVLDTTPGHVVRAIDWAVDRGIRLLNLSLGTQREDAREGLLNACDRAHAAGVTIVAAAHQQTGYSYPAVFETVIGVRAGPVSQPLEYRYNANASVEIATDSLDRGSKYWRPSSSSSIAAALVSGIAALLLEAHPTAGPQELRALLRKYATRDSDVTDTRATDTSLASCGSHRPQGQPGNLFGPGTTEKCQDYHNW